MSEQGEQELTWPSGISDGLSLRCGDCGEVPRFDYRVRDEFWRRWVPEDDKRLGVICLSCLDQRCGGAGLADALVVVQWLGTEHTVEMEPARVVEYEYFGNRPSEAQRVVHAARDRRQRLAVLVLAAHYFESAWNEAVPQAAWYWAFGEGLAAQVSDQSGERVPYLTERGQDRLREMLGA